MQIGELSRRSGVPSRMLRYYEKQGLLTSQRQTNGYRDYATDAVQRTRQIRALIESGLPTAIIVRLLPCFDKPDDLVLHEECPEMIALLEDQRDSITGRIDALSRNLEAINDYLAATRSHAGRRTTA